MLKATFRCFRGLSPTTEERLWERGILHWNDLTSAGPGLFSPGKERFLHARIREAEKALTGGCADYFLGRLDGVHAVRTLHDFRAETAYLDIETTGLERTAAVTSIALYFRGRVMVYVAGINLGDFLTDIRKPSLLVTYNGTRFDLPRLRKRFGIALALPHIDLCPILMKMGYRGGLKGIERRMGIGRPGCGIHNGREAIELWNRYCRTGSSEILEDIVRYNAWDVGNLERICGRLYRTSMSAYPVDVPFLLPKSIAVRCDDTCSLTIEYVHM